MGRSTGALTAASYTTGSTKPARTRTTRACPGGHSMLALPSLTMLPSGNRSVRLVCLSTRLLTRCNLLRSYLNGALAATGSMHFSQCLWQSVPKTLDVILIEFAVNEGGNPHCDSSMELIVRDFCLSFHNGVRRGFVFPGSGVLT